MAPPPCACSRWPRRRSLRRLRRAYSGRRLRLAGARTMAWVPAESAVEELMPRLLPVEPCDLTEGFDPSVPPRTPQEYLRRVQWVISPRASGLVVVPLCTALVPRLTLGVQQSLLCLRSYLSGGPGNLRSYYTLRLADNFWTWLHVKTCVLKFLCFSSRCQAFRFFIGSLHFYFPFHNKVKHISLFYKAK